ncbi:hypothetical protein ACR3IL_09015 [Streptococcus iniae]|uniref:hypothetical protein n=1 Tax=Streptococcus agalactiae TaxID=1311 RepID=UPI0018EED38F|nr:hypothetical protein [Streptococcus agalactiae]ELY5747359.1 hypothetical protein [Streptococcus iniae]
MTEKEKSSRDLLINFFMDEMKISRKEALKIFSELEQFNLINISSSGQLVLKVV